MTERALLRKRETAPTFEVAEKRSANDGQRVAEEEVGAESRRRKRKQSLAKRVSCRQKYDYDEEEVNPQPRRGERGGKGENKEEAQRGGKRR